MFQLSYVDTADNQNSAMFRPDIWHEEETKRKLSLFIHNFDKRQCL